MTRSALKEIYLRQRSKLVGALMLLLVLTLSSLSVSGHAKLLRSQPAANATLKQAPRTVELWFSEELEPPMCHIIVTDQNGNRVDKNNGSLAEGNKKQQIDLEELQSGTYTVDWMVLSTDQHTMKGKFTFTVALSGSTGSAPSTARSPGAQEAGKTQPPQESSPAPQSMQESGTGWTQSLIRWLKYLAMMMLTGGFAFHALVLGPALRRSRSMSDAQRAGAISASDRRIIFLSWLSLALLVIVTLVELVLQAASVFNQSVGGVLSPSLLNQIITRTGFGASWRLQVWAVASLLVLVIYLSRNIKRDPARDHRMWWWSSLVAGAVLLLAPSWTGHAVVAAKEFPFAIVSDWLHLLAAGFWVGGLFHLALTLPKALADLKGPARLDVLHRVIPLFTRLAIASTILIVLTGLYNSWMHVDRFGELWSTPYGETLLVKVLLVVPMLVLGGINTFIIHPRVRRLIENGEDDPGAEGQNLEHNFARSVTVEAALGALVLLVASVLVFLQPAREHPTAMSQNKSMDRIVTEYLKQ
jgi:copper transport protein